MQMKEPHLLRLLATALALTAELLSLDARAQTPPEGAPPPPTASESALGELIITGHKEEKLPRIAILPSLSAALEDVIVRSVVRRDIELTGMFDMIPDAKAPPGLYDFDDPVDVPAWQKLGAEAIVKVAARPAGNKVEVLGLAYFLNVGKDPVYQKKIVVDKADTRVTAHRITDALLGALTGRPGGFASQLAFAARWTKNQRIFRMDADGQGLEPLTDANEFAVAPTWGQNGTLFYASSKDNAPLKLFSLTGKTVTPVKLQFATSVYAVTFNKDYSKMAVAVAENGKSSIYVGLADGSGMTKASTTELATRPVFSPTGKLAWIGGDPTHGSQRVYVDGKPVSPSGFGASGPTFCDTEDGVRLVYSVSVGNDQRDLVMSDDQGRGIVRLTQGQGSNTYPACSPDGRLLAFFSTRKGQPGIYMMSLKRFTTQLLTSKMGESLHWAALPPPADGK